MHLGSDATKTGVSDVQSHPEMIRVDCRARAARDVFLQVLPACLGAATASRPPVLILTNLGFLQDSVTRLLKTLERMAADLGAGLELEDGSGFCDAFVRAIVPAARPRTVPCDAPPGEER